MKSLRHLILLLVALILLPDIAGAGVRITMSDRVDPEAEVVVETKIRYAGFHGYRHKALGTALLKAGESQEKTVWAVIPVLYESVYANAYHPAYYIDASSSEKTPVILRTIQLPVLQPRSWAGLLETGEPILENGVGITAGNVQDHFNMILRYFLPAFDRAGGTENLRRHLPLLEKLAAFAQTAEALENSMTAVRSYSQQAADKYLDTVKQIAQRDQVELLQQLEAIKGWLALEQGERLPMYDWLKNLHKPDYVYDRVMDDADRQKVHDLLEESEQSGQPRSATWTNPVTRVKFTLTLDTRTLRKGVPGYRTRLFTDLNPRLGVAGNVRYGKACSPGFNNDEQSGWQLVRK